MRNEVTKKVLSGKLHLQFGREVPMFYLIVFILR